MLEIRKILQLLQRGISNRKIARQLSMSRNTLDYYRGRFRETDKTYEQLLNLSNQELAAIVHKERTGPKKDSRYERLAPQIEGFTKELQKTGVTRLLLWQEYREKDHDGYSYQQFCEHLNTFMAVKSAVMRLEHHPGETMEFDFAGDKISYVDPETGEEVSCIVFVAVLPYSGYTYCKALRSAGLEHLIPALSECAEFFGGVPLNFLTDNMAQIVTKSDRYEPTFTDMALQWSVHYNTNLTATRVRKPKDKASAEKGVDLIYKRVYAPLRNMTFYSLEELNYHMLQQLKKHNEALFQNRDYSRKEKFLLEEKPHLLPLPEEPFDLKYTIKRKVGKDYHVTLGKDYHHYSVPYRYIGKAVSLVYDSQHVEIFDKFDRIAIHQRDYRKHFFTTQDKHMPQSHQAYKESKGWKPEYFIDKATTVGPQFAEYMRKVLGSRKYTAQAYKSCLGLIRLIDRYPQDRLEKASKMAIASPSASFKTLETILKNNGDKQIELPVPNKLPPHDNIRGGEEYLDF